MSRKALCVGINNYPGTENDLSGCVNDANDWAGALKTRGYKVTLLHDKDATRANIVAELTGLLAGAAKEDNLVFTYSGHGSWVPDENGDEADGRDEMLCPYDINKSQYLLDDDLATIFAKKPEGARLTFISDSCHSGTVTRFAPEPLAGDMKLQPRIRFLPPEVFLKSKDEILAARRVALIGRSIRQKYPALLVAACTDLQYSYDAHFHGRPNGAFSYWAIKELDKKPETPKLWMKAIRTHLPTAVYPQNPRLYGSTAAKNGAMF